MASRLGKMPTLSVRRRISRLSRSLGLLDQICDQRPSGNSVNARMSARAVSRCSNASGSLSSTCSAWKRTRYSPTPHRTSAADARLPLGIVTSRSSKRTDPCVRVF